MPNWWKRNFTWPTLTKYWTSENIRVFKICPNTKLCKGMGGFEKSPDTTPDANTGVRSQVYTSREYMSMERGALGWGGPHWGRGIVRQWWRRTWVWRARPPAIPCRGLQPSRILCLPEACFFHFEMPASHGKKGTCQAPPTGGSSISKKIGLKMPSLSVAIKKAR